MLDVGRHSNIELLAYSELENVQGEAGNFRATVRKKARFVDEDKCTGCGNCAAKCPTSVPDAFNEGLSNRKAIYSWFAQGIPSTFTIDTDYCRQFQGKKCGICQKSCQAEAINFEQEDQFLELDVGAVIVATGYKVFDPSRIPEYRYNQIPNVLTSMEFERMLGASGPTEGHLERPSDRKIKNQIQDLEKKLQKAEKSLGKFEEEYQQDSETFHSEYKQDKYPEDKERKKWADKYEEYLGLKETLRPLREQAENFKDASKLAFIQCVGSRDKRFFPFCSGYCCMHSIKEAIIAHEHDPETTSTIFGMDIRAVGKGFEEYKIRSQNSSNVFYKRARVAEITESPNRNPVLTYEDTKEQKVKSEEFELVILATACEPSSSTEPLAETLGIEINEFGFFKTDYKNPLDSTKPGIFICGCANDPMDIPESVAQASSAAARAVQVLTGLGDSGSERVSKAS